MFRAMQVPILGVVENMSYLELPDGSRMDIFGQGGGESLAKDAGVPFIGGIPMDAVVREAGDSGLPVVLGRPDSAVGRALIAMAEDVAARVSVLAKSKAADVVPIQMID
jgi:ATP-binding protein involved in chromosome partitioning